MAYKGGKYLREILILLLISEGQSPNIFNFQQKLPFAELNQAHPGPYFLSNSTHIFQNEGLHHRHYNLALPSPHLRNTHCHARAHPSRRKRLCALSTSCRRATSSIPACVPIGTSMVISKSTPHSLFRLCCPTLFKHLIIIDNPESVTDVIAVSGNDDADCTIFFMSWAPRLLGGDGGDECCSSAWGLFD